MAEHLLIPVLVMVGVLVIRQMTVGVLVTWLVTVEVVLAIRQVLVMVGVVVPVT